MHGSSGWAVFSIDRPEVLRILRVLSEQEAFGSRRREASRTVVHPMVWRVTNASRRSGSRGVDMKRKKGDGDEEFDVFGDDEAEIDSEAIEDDEELSEDDDLDDDDEFEDDDDFDGDFVEGDEFTAAEGDFDEFGSEDNER